MMTKEEFNDMELEVTFEHYKDRLLYWVNKHDKDANFDDFVEFDVADTQPGIPDFHMRIDYVGFNEETGVSEKRTMFADIDDWLDALYF